jgi:hypothetical protein
MMMMMMSLISSIEGVEDGFIWLKIGSRGGPREQGE